MKHVFPGKSWLYGISEFFDSETILINKLKTCKSVQSNSSITQFKWAKTLYIKLSFLQPSVLWFNSIFFHFWWKSKTKQAPTSPSFFRHRIEKGHFWPMNCIFFVVMNLFGVPLVQKTKWIRRWKIYSFIKRDTESHLLIIQVFRE